MFLLPMQNMRCVEFQLKSEATHAGEEGYHLPISDYWGKPNEFKAIMDCDERTNFVR